MKTRQSEYSFGIRPRKSIGTVKIHCSMEVVGVYLWRFNPIAFLGSLPKSMGAAREFASVIRVNKKRAISLIRFVGRKFFAIPGEASPRRANFEFR